MTEPPFLVVLAQRARHYTVQRLVGAGSALGLRIVVADPAACALRIAPGKGEVIFEGLSLEPAIAAIACFPSSAARPGAAVLRQLDTLGVPCFNAADALIGAWDRVACVQVLSRADVDVPPTTVAASVDVARRVLDMAGGPPVVVHAHDESPSSAGMPAEDPAAATSLVETLSSLQRVALVQKQESREVTATVRAFVLEGELIVAGMRVATSEKPEALTAMSSVGKGVADVAVAATRALKLRWASVDLEETTAGIVVVGADPAPGLLAFEAATHVDLAGQIVRAALGQQAASRRWHVS